MQVREMNPNALGRFRRPGFFFATTAAATVLAMDTFTGSAAPYLGSESSDATQGASMEQGVRLIRVPLTGFSLHIDGGLVMVDHDKALVNVTRLPYWFLDDLADLGIELIHAWPTEGKAVNSLAVRPGKVIIAEGCPRTVERLNARGVETVEIPYDEVLKNGGGIHCSTLPLIRDAE